MSIPSGFFSDIGQRKSKKINIPSGDEYKCMYTYTHANVHNRTSSTVNSDIILLFVVVTVGIALRVPCSSNSSGRRRLSSLVADRGYITALYRTQTKSSCENVAAASWLRISSWFIRMENWAYCLSASHWAFRTAIVGTCYYYGRRLGIVAWHVIA